MREIKFRGKSKNVNKWCYGTYIFTDDNRNDPFRTRPFKESHKIVFWCSRDWNMGGWVDEEVIPETIGQYTGLKDKNGKEIYEGDIMRIPETEFNIEIIGVVEFDRGSYFVRSFFSGTHSSLAWAVRERQSGERRGVIIGNIHDNPELI